MSYSIFAAGNLVTSFDREAPAREALDLLAERSPGASDGLMLVAFDDEGTAVADWVPRDPAQHAA